MLFGIDKPVYCEPALFNGLFEPLNVLSNIIFIILGILLFNRVKRKSVNSFLSKVFPVLFVAIGIGSTLWHYFRSDLSFRFDVTPVIVLITLHVACYAKVVGKTVIEKLLLFLSVFAFLSIGLLLKAQYEYWLFNYNGVLYIAIWFYYMFVWLYSLFTYKLRQKSMPLIMALFTLAILARQADMLSCETFGFGSHFLWHLFSAVALFLFSEFLLVFKSRGANPK